LAVPLAVACSFTYVWSGHRGIYLSQLMDTPKTDDPNTPLETTLDRIRRSEPPLVLNFSPVGRLASRAVGRKPIPTPSLQGGPRMNGERRLNARTLGLVRIYMKYQDRRPARGWTQRLFSKPLYQDIIDQARDAGLMTATAKAMAYGFSNYGPKTQFHPDLGYINMNIYVELISPRESLEAFLDLVGPLVADRVVVFKEVEQWMVRARNAAAGEDERAGRNAA
jgi:PII-like signaling protein